MTQCFIGFALGQINLINGAAGAQCLNHGIAAFNNILTFFFYFFVFHGNSSCFLKFLMIQIQYNIFRGKTKE